MFFQKSAVVEDRLRYLGKYLSGQLPFIYQFANFLADRPTLKGKVTPFYFIEEAKLAILDLGEGRDGYAWVNGYPGKPLNHELVGFSIPLLKLAVPIIAEAIFPAWLAKEARKLISQDSLLS